MEILIKSQEIFLSLICGNPSLTYILTMTVNKILFNITRFIQRLNLFFYGRNLIHKLKLIPLSESIA